VTVAKKPKQIADGEIEVRKVAELKPHPKNPRTHPEAQVAGIAGAYEEFGVLSVPVVDDKGTILAGHARIEAAKKKGIYDIKVFVVKGWTEKKKVRFMLGDNRWQELAGYDDAVLRDLLAEASQSGDVGSIGYDEAALAKLLAVEQAPGEFQEFGEGIDIEHQCPKCGYRWSGNSAPKADEPKGKKAK
jgi:ParB-like chromosome segregation protein Spo0J